MLSLRNWNSFNNNKHSEMFSLIGVLLSVSFSLFISNGTGLQLSSFFSLFSTHRWLEYQQHLYIWTILACFSKCWYNSFKYFLGFLCFKLFSSCFSSFFVCFSFSILLQAVKEDSWKFQYLVGNHLSSSEIIMYNSNFHVSVSKNVINYSVRILQVHSSPNSSYRFLLFTNSVLKTLTILLP